VSSPETYRRHRYPIEVVEHCVWLYFRFALSYRNVEEMMAKRGVQVTYETVRMWCQKFGTLYAARLRRQRPPFGLNWHLDEVFIRINGIQHYLWRAVDQHGCHAALKWVFLNLWAIGERRLVCATCSTI
jgi:putative transposase